MHTRTISQGVFVFDKGDRREKNRETREGWPLRGWIE
jgi:hypothetical protein